MGQMIWYCTREDVAGAPDIREPARAYAQIDDAIASGARSVEALLHRTFYPQLETRVFDWPNLERQGHAWQLWLLHDELIRLDEITSGGEAIPTEHVNLEPANDGPPFTRVELRLDTSSVLGRGATHQRDIAITGLWGYRDTETAAGQLTSSATQEATEIDVSDGSQVGVGSLLRLGDERMVVQERRWADTGRTLAEPLQASMAAQEVPLANADQAFTAGERLLVGAERLLVRDVLPDRLVVYRADDGSTLADHDEGATVYASRRLVVDRGVLGTDAASHDDGAQVHRWQPPPLVRSLNIAEAVTELQQMASSYGRTVGSGDNEREAAGKGLLALRSQAQAAHGRMARKAAV